jgi:hypothetical protein
MRKAMPIVIMPNSATRANTPVRLRKVRKPGPKTEKMMNITRKEVIAPNSGHLRIRVESENPCILVVSVSVFSFMDLFL